MMMKMFLGEINCDPVFLSFHSFQTHNTHQAANDDVEGDDNDEANDDDDKANDDDYYTDAFADDMMMGVGNIM